MSVRTLGLSDSVHAYLVDRGVREPDVMRRLREETQALPMARMQISPEQGQFMTLLTEMLGVERALEVGTFTGYSALAVARALPENGELVACDVSEEWTAIGQRYWAEAGVSERIDLRIGPAVETLRCLVQGGGAGSFDLAFIDADKSNYLHYYELSLELLRIGGVVAVDNVLWSGSVADPSNQEEDTVAIRELNDRLKIDERVTVSMLPLGDGLTLARKR